MLVYQSCHIMFRIMRHGLFNVTVPNTQIACSRPIFRDICLIASKFYQMHWATMLHMGHVRLDCQEFVM